MNFIKLTSPSGKPVLINFDTVCEIRPVEQGTKIFFCFVTADGRQETSDVKEKMDQITAVL